MRRLSDIIACVRFAQDHALPVAVRGSGHACAGTALCDDGLVVDMSRMKGIRVVPDGGIVRAEPGVTWGDMDHATQAFGFAVPGGTDSEVGIADLSLGGGNGWLMGAFGATCDNILSLDVVTAEGRLVTASASEHEDLFWALRGGGGNFGIATSLEYSMHALGTYVVAGGLFPVRPNPRGAGAVPRLCRGPAGAADGLSVPNPFGRRDAGSVHGSLLCRTGRGRRAGGRGVASSRRATLRRTATDAVRRLAAVDGHGAPHRPALRDKLAFPRRTRRRLCLRADL